MKVSFMLALCILSLTEARPIPDFDLKDASDVLEGKKKLHIALDSDGVKFSTGPSTEEIAAYVAIVAAILLMAVCCFCCCKHCCCARKPQTTTIIYHQISDPRQIGQMQMPGHSSAMFRPQAPPLTVNFDPMPSVEELSRRRDGSCPPAYSASACTTNIPL